MNALEHYRQAEKLLATDSGGNAGIEKREQAQVHATLALAGATALAALSADGNGRGTYRALASLGQDAARTTG